MYERKYTTLTYVKTATFVLSKDASYKKGIGPNKNIPFLSMQVKYKTYALLKAAITFGISKWSKNLIPFSVPTTTNKRNIFPVGCNVSEVSLAKELYYCGSSQYIAK